ncbi:MAG: 30S ribosomal protein S9 [Candidatus Marsarchaeota archaeon]|jgi:small subunit ribosomal protein S9|nr:30S ribosomal protein S9 [Candidatus Marsarchaeota archaeon]
MADKMQEEKQKKKAPKRAVKKKEHIVLSKSKRKTSVARASAKSGTGKIRVNGTDINIIEPAEIRGMMLNSIKVSQLGNDISKRTDITVSVYGGGYSSQAQAVGAAIARCIADLDESGSVRKELMDYDRSLIVDDSRRVEPKKFLGPKARARFQTSYR